MFNRTKNSNMCIEQLYFVKCMWTTPPPQLQNENNKKSLNIENQNRKKKVQVQEKNILNVWLKILHNFPDNIFINVTTKSKNRKKSL